MSSFPSEYGRLSLEGGIGEGVSVCLGWEFVCYSLKKSNLPNSNGFGRNNLSHFLTQKRYNIAYRIYFRPRGRGVHLD